MHAYFANMQGDYAAAAAAGAEGAALADRTGDSFMRATCQYQQCWALLHAGDWAALLATLHAALRVAERSDHPLWALVFKLTLAWWSTHTGDYDFAAEGAADGLRCARGRTSARHRSSRCWHRAGPSSDAATRVPRSATSPR